MAMNNENNNPNKRVTRGRQKVVMMKMTNESNLQVTFSKRRSGLFKKASELCTLCGVELAMIVFSPGGKVFSFGHSSVNSIMDRYLNPQNHRTTSQANSGTSQLVEAHRNANVRDLNQQLSHATDQLDVERKRSNELKKARKARAFSHWTEAPAEALNDLGYLEHVKSLMETLRKATTQQADHILIQTTANANSLLPPNFNTININTPSFYGAVTTAGGGGGGSGNNESGRALPSAASAPNQGGVPNMLNQQQPPNNNNNHYNKTCAGTSSVNHVNKPHVPQMQAMTSGGMVNNHVMNLQPHMQVSGFVGGSSTVNHVNLRSHIQVNNNNNHSSGGGSSVNHMNFSPMPHGNSNYINMSTMPHMEVKPSPASSVISHVNVSAMPHMHHSNPQQSLPPFTQLLSQQSNPHRTHHALNTNVGYGHGFF